VGFAPEELEANSWKLVAVFRVLAAQRLERALVWRIGNSLKGSGSRGKTNSKSDFDWEKKKWRI
jgi:hypothetical protein